MQPVGLRAGLSETFATEFVGKKESIAFEVGEGEVGQIELLNRPLRGVSPDLFRWNASPEKGELKSKLPASGGREMAGVIPPFGTKPFVGAMVFRKCLPVTGLGGVKGRSLVVRCHRVQGAGQKHDHHRQGGERRMAHCDHVRLPGSRPCPVRRRGR